MNQVAGIGLTLYFLYGVYCYNFSLGDDDLQEGT